MWRPRNIYYRKTMDDNDTWKDELPEAGKCTRLTVQIRQKTMTGKHQYDAADGINPSRPADKTTKVEIVVGGNRPIKSLTGVQAQIFDFYRNKRAPPDYLRDLSLSPQYSYLHFDFGRYFGDKEYYMDWGKHKINELRITNNVDGTIWDALTCNVDEWIWEGPTLPPTKGVFNDRQLKTYTTIQDGEEPTAIPLTDPLRSLAIQVIPLDAASAPYTYKDAIEDCANVVDLSMQEERLKILDDYRVAEMIIRNGERYGEAVQGGIYCSGAASPEAMLTGIGRRLGTTVNFADITGTALITNFMGLYTYADNPITVTCQSATNSYYDWIAHGLAFHDSIMLYDAEENVIENLLKSDKAPVNLRIDTADASAAADAKVNILLSSLQAL